MDAATQSMAGDQSQHELLRGKVRNLAFLPIVLMVGPVAAISRSTHGDMVWAVAVAAVGMAALVINNLMTYKYMLRTPLMRADRGGFEYLGYGKRDYRSVRIDEIVQASVTTSGRFPGSSRLSVELRGGQVWNMSLWGDDTSPARIAAIRAFLASEKISKLGAI